MILPPHEVTDPGLQASMMATLQMGGELPPVIVCHNQAISGSHRIAAWNAMGMQPDVIPITVTQLTDALHKLGIRFDQIERALDL